MSVCVRCKTPIPIGAVACPQCGTGVAMMAPPQRKKSPLTWVLIGCAVLVPVVAFVGIIAALLIPNFLDALQKAKQTRAMIDLRQASAELDGYRASHDGIVPMASNIAALNTALAEPRPIPLLDPWKHPYFYVCWQESPTSRGCDHYRIASAGRDGQLNGELRSISPGTFPRSEYDHDIVFGEDGFAAMPESRRR